MKKIALYLYIASIHLVLLIVIIQPSVITTIKNKFITNSNEMNNFYSSMLAYHQRLDRNINDNAILFLGDSLTQGLAVSSVTPYAVNYGIGHDTTTGLINRLSLYNSLHKVKLIVVEIGHNDLYIRSEKDIIKNFKVLFDSLPSQTKIIVNSIFPIDESKVLQFNYNQNKPMLNNQAIFQLNKKLELLSTHYKNIYFLNIFNELITNGQLDSKYHIGDGIHLNTQGNNLWIKRLSITINNDTL